MYKLKASVAHVILVGQPHRTAELAAALDANRWVCTRVSTPLQALVKARLDSSIDLLLLATGEPLADFVELCRSLKFDKRSCRLPVVFAALDEHLGSVGEIFGAGADDCIRQNATQQEIVWRLSKAIRDREFHVSAEDASAVIKSLANAIEGKDHYTCGHVERVSDLSTEIGRRMNLDEQALHSLAIGGIVHDIGKVGIRDGILNKPAKLTEAEFAEMSRHPVIGYEILEPLASFKDVLPIVRWHHEKPNGTGYPDRLSHNQIPLLAKITAVADVFDALVTDRPYRKALSLAECKSILVRAADAGDLDDAPVEVLLHILDGGVPQG